MEQRVTFEFECVELPGNSFGEWREVRLGIQEARGSGTTCLQMCAVGSVIDEGRRIRATLRV